MGLDMADRMCFEQAKAMGLAPNYRAFISSHRQDLVHVVYPGFRQTLPVTNLRVSAAFYCQTTTSIKISSCPKHMFLNVSNPLCLTTGRHDV